MKLLSRLVLATLFPFYPSLLSTADGRAVTSSDFEDPGICRSCHPEIYKQWNGSMHANAFVDPVCQALWRIGIKETDGAVERLCAGCHTAIGTVAGEVKLGPDGVFQASEIAKKGVQNVFHPSNNFPIEDTCREWKNSVYAQAGIQCQDCHMMPVEKAIEAARTLVKPVNPGQPCITGPQREQMYTHEFVGANAVVTELLGAGAPKIPIVDMVATSGQIAIR